VFCTYIIDEYSLKVTHTGSKRVGVEVVVLYYKIIYYNTVHFVVLSYINIDFLLKCAVRTCCGRKL